VANERVTNRDVAIEPGDVVVVLIGAANHDEARFFSAAGAARRRA
jgi:cytochrome P450